MLDKKWHSFPRLLLQGIAINFYISALISAVVWGTSARAPDMPVLFFLVLVVSVMATTTGYFLCRFTFRPYGIPLLLSAVLFTAWLALHTCVFLVPLLFPAETARDALRFIETMTPAVYLITGLLTIAGIYLEWLRKKMKGGSVSDADEIASREIESREIASREIASREIAARESLSAPAEGIREGKGDSNGDGDGEISYLLLKECENRHRLKFDEIVYLSSHGRRTTIHTREESLVVARLLKELQTALPDREFIRIHKQYIINAAYLIRLRHERAGQYRAFLSDEDATGLPVGRSYLPSLRRRFPA